MQRMADTNGLEQKIYSLIEHLVQDGSVRIRTDTPLIGDGRVLDSMKLVELCLLLEDMAGELEFDFDWTSATAMSKSRSMFRTAGALAEEFTKQKASRTP
jgi:acyl carrier protein